MKLQTLCMVSMLAVGCDSVAKLSVLGELSLSAQDIAELTRVSPQRSLPFALVLGVSDGMSCQFEGSNPNRPLTVEFELCKKVIFAIGPKWVEHSTDNMATLRCRAAQRSVRCNLDRGEGDVKPVYVLE